MIKFYLPSLYVLLVFMGCKGVPEQVQNVLDKAGNNKAELEKVITHYQNSKEEKKLNAAYFLIGNMENKCWYDGENIRNFNVLFNILDSLWKVRRDVVHMDKYIKSRWDSLAHLYGEPSLRANEKYRDYYYLKADYLIENIDKAFEICDASPWCKGLSFENFCEYMLPYRVGTELPEHWRKSLSDKWKIIRDTLMMPTREKLGAAINKQNFRKMHHLKIFWSYPFDMSASQLELARLGSCKHTVYYTAMALRANGIPAGVDYAPLWAGGNNGHEWNVLLKEDGTFYPFDAIDKEFKIDFSMRKIGKVFRETYTEQPIEFDNSETDLPPKFFNKYRRDVTHEYVKAYDITLPIEKFLPKKKYAVICSFDNKNWMPQYWGSIKDDQVVFKNMGSGVMYKAMYFHNQKLYPASEAFELDTLGRVQFLNPDLQHRQQLHLTRKYPLTTFMRRIMGFVVGCRFQVANQLSFKDSLTVYNINTVPEKIETAYINNPKKYRYVRMYIPPKGRGDMAELEFYGLSENGKDTIKLKGKVIGQPAKEVLANEFYQHPFDGDLLTYFLNPDKPDTQPWVGLDLGKPQHLVKIRYCPRSDANFIEIGHTYELFYLRKNKWISMGKKLAITQSLDFMNVPSKALYLLHDHTNGTEERIFTYENNKQVWW